MSSQILDDIHTFLGRFIAYPSEEARVANTLWVAHTHLMDEWQFTPRLAVLSPELGSGKTRVLDITALLVARPVKTENATPAYIFRKVSDLAGLPTILYDEIDTIFGSRAKKEGNEEMRGLFNAGYQRGGMVGRCSPNTFETQEFPAYCALAFAGIDNLRGIDTVLSRSVIIKMRRRKPSETVEPYRARTVDPEGHALRERIAEWAHSLKGIGIGWPKMPEGVDDRDADLWEPLIAVADAAGGDWPETARVAAVTLVTGSQRDTEESYNIRLLSDLRDLFGETDKLFTSSIIEGLRTKAPWSTINRGGPIDALLLARFLNKHNAYPKGLRIKEKISRGYERADLVDAWEAYLPPLPGKALHPLHPLQGGAVPAEKLDQRLAKTTVWVNGEQRSLADIIREKF